MQMWQQAFLLQLHEPVQIIMRDYTKKKDVHPAGCRYFLHRQLRYLIDLVAAVFWRDKITKNAHILVRNYNDVFLV